jgi:ketosteroid isomerase-like protein
MAAELKREPTDQTILMQLNQEYVEAFMNADVEWYQTHLTEDFEVIESDGSTLNKMEFLTNTAKGPDVIEYKLQDVKVRIFGDVALVRATGLWTGRNGFQGMSRYTDVYVRTEKGWKATSAQITRAAVPGPRGRYKRPKKLL